MSRKKRALKRAVIDPDPVYGSVLVSKFVNRMMYCGLKTKSENIFYKALKELEAKSEEKGLDLFNEIVSKVVPQVEVVSRRIGGSNFQIPSEVKKERGISLSIRWIVKYARLRKEHGMVNKLTNEFFDILKGTAASYKKKMEVHKIADSNKAFSHLRR